MIASDDHEPFPGLYVNRGCIRNAHFEVRQRPPLIGFEVQNEALLANFVNGVDSCLWGWVASAHEHSIRGWTRGQSMADSRRWHGGWVTIWQIAETIGSKNINVFRPSGIFNIFLFDYVLENWWSFTKIQRCQSSHKIEKSLPNIPLCLAWPPNINRTL